MRKTRCGAGLWLLALAGALGVVGGLTAQGTNPGGVRPTPLSGAQVVFRQQPGAGQPGAGQPGAAQPGQLPPPRPAGAPDGVLAPRAGNPFGQMNTRLQGLAATVPPPLGTTPIPDPETLKKFRKYVIGFVDPENTLDLVSGQPRLMNLTEAPFRVQVANEQLVTYNFFLPTQLSLLGTGVGTTVLNMWFGDPERTETQTVLSWLVHVLPDPEAKARLERVYKALEDEINRAFPDSYVCLFLVGDKLVLTGEAKDPIEAAQILQIIQGNNQQTGAQASANIPVTQVALNLTAADLGPDGRPLQALENYLTGGESNIINLLRVPGVQQVMLKVTVAEMSRAAARSAGINFSITNNQGIRVFQQGSGTQGNLPFILDNGQVLVALQALRTINLARSLAEPNLVTTNGLPALFFAGGEFPVPVVTGATAVGLQGTTFVPFGVQLSFTPFIVDRDRIRLQLQASISTRDVSIGTNIGGANVAGLTQRVVTTTVEMREGQTFAIAGLVQNNLGSNTTRVPLVGDIPFGGQFFRSDSTSASESEIVLLVTPQLVHPMEPQEVPPLPGSDFFEPGDLEFYLLGRLESQRAYDYRSPVMTTLHRMAAYRHCELLYFVGPHGHTDTKAEEAARYGQ